MGVVCGGVFIKTVKYYVTEQGKAPFEEWFRELDKFSRAIIIRLIQRVASGGAKKSVKSLKNGIYEIKTPHGPGYRVYFAEDHEEILILLAGGDKKTQERDIEKAKEYWWNYGK
ncbi:MAG: type II toxin-antitoxin system RelE/ParE family toxin [Bacteriovoracaceae bacterium]|nr:type II toxin-antitoxin system RelE/ParE family toxin [Bacteriovoracaceae bacterium]